MFFVPEMIDKKKRGGRLSKEEISFLIEGYVDGDIPDYQIAALLMAIYFKGMDEEETTDLTMAMARSGSILDLSSIEGIKVDKHSTGGIGDSTTLVILALAASAGVKVPKMSGRGLGHTGGTIDKLEAIPGFSVDLDPEEFTGAIRDMGAAITGQSQGLAPADGLLYSLRDVTGTVDSIPLIASSIMSKKIAGGADKILLDVKLGSGAFMKSYQDALELGQLMVRIGNLAGRETIAYITDMEQPLSLAIGNSLEVVEALEVLKGRGHEDLQKLSLEFAGEMMLLAGIAQEKAQAINKLEDKIASGAAFDKFAEIVANQGGDPFALENYQLLPKAPVEKEVLALEDGYISGINALGIGQVAMKLGAGRQSKEDKIDLGVGIQLYGKVGQQVMKGKPIAKVLGKRWADCLWAGEEVQKHIKLSATPVPMRKVILTKITQNSIRKY